MPDPIIPGFQEKEKHALLAAIVNFSNDAIISVTQEGTVITWNAAAEQLSGYTEGEAAGKHISLFLTGSGIEKKEGTTVKEVTVYEQSMNNIVAVKTKDNRYISVSCTVSPVKDNTGAVAGTSLILRRFSDTPDAQAHKDHIQHEIKLLGSRLDELVAAASHELKTPLTTLKCSLQLLNKIIPPDEKGTPMITSCLSQVDRTTSLINHLEVFSEMLTTLQLHPETFELGGLIREVVAPFEEGNHRFTFADSKALWLTADRDGIRQVLISLLENAVKYTPAGGTIGVDMTEEVDAVVVSVKDSGIGIDMGNAEKIFSPFYRAAGTEDPDPGPGMGLYISREIIRLHSGTICVQSEPGEGSLFTFTVPKREHADAIPADNPPND